MVSLSARHAAYRLPTLYLYLDATMKRLEAVLLWTLNLPVEIIPNMIDVASKRGDGKSMGTEDSSWTTGSGAEEATLVVVLVGVESDSSADVVSVPWLSDGSENRVVRYEDRLTVFFETNNKASFLRFKDRHELVLCA